jgi:hypothetical protein
MKGKKLTIVTGLRCNVLLGALLLATSAQAHQGDHTVLTLSAFVDHLLEWDHLAMLAGAVVVAVVGFRWIKARRSGTDGVK